MMYTNLERYAMAYKKVMSKYWHPHDLEQAWPKLYQALKDCDVSESNLFSWETPSLSYAHELAAQACGIPPTVEAIVAYITMDRHDKP